VQTVAAEKRPLPAFDYRRDARSVQEQFGGLKVTIETSSQMMPQNLLKSDPIE
jgi:hypothetical protein